MTMRGLIWFVLLFAAAAGLALVGVFDGGQVLLVMPPYRVDISLNLFVVALVVSFIVIYAVLRAVRSVLKMPQRVSAYRTRSRLAKANAALRDAIGHLYAGRFSKAEKSARDSLIVDENAGAAGLIGAKAAHEMHEYALSRRMAFQGAGQRLAGRSLDGHRRHARRWPRCGRCAGCADRNAGAGRPPPACAADRVARSSS